VRADGLSGELAAAYKNRETSVGLLESENLLDTVTKKRTMRRETQPPPEDSPPEPQEPLPGAVVGSSNRWDEWIRVQ
jgi:hypothetical protein